MTRAHWFWLIAFVPFAATAQRPDTVVRTANTPKHAGVAAVVEELSIGVVDGANEYMFADIFDMVPGANGSLLVMDRGAMELRQYDAAGKFVRTLARRGQGPGEIMTPSGMVLLRDGRLLLYDSGNRRINVYTPNGSVGQQWTPGLTGVSLARVLVADTAGSVYVQQNRMTRHPGKFSSGRPITEFLPVWFRLSATDGRLVDSVVLSSWGPPVEPFFSAGANGGWRQMAMPYIPRRIAVMSPMGYVVTGRPSQYAFELRAPSGPIVRVRRDVPPAAVTAKERDVARSRIEAGMREENPLWSWEGRDIPTTKPVYSDMLVGLDGRIWIVRQEPTAPMRLRTPSGGRVGGAASMSGGAVPQDTVERNALYDVFEPSGDFLGQVQAPLRVKPLTMRGDHVWAIARDEDDVQFAKRYRIAWK